MRSLRRRPIFKLSAMRRSLAQGGGAATGFVFGAAHIPAAQLFYESELVVGLVNHRPIVKGHVLVAPRRCAKRVADLTRAEVAHLAVVGQLVGRELERHHKTTSLTYVVQDGPLAGQSVPHVHMHLIPRRSGDFEPNDAVYREIEASDLSQRPVRTAEDMAEEANVLRGLLKSAGGADCDLGRPLVV